MHFLDVYKLLKIFIFHMGQTNNFYANVFLKIKYTTIFF